MFYQSKARLAPINELEPSLKNWSACVNAQGVETAALLPFACGRSSYKRLKVIISSAITLLNAAQTQSASETLVKHSVSDEN